MGGRRQLGLGKARHGSVVEVLVPGLAAQEGAGSFYTRLI